MVADLSELEANLAAKQAEFEAARHMFACCLSLVQGEFEQTFPEGCYQCTGDRGGMARLGSRLEDLANVYDRFQAALGLHDGERTRFASFFTGRPGVTANPPAWHRPDSPN
jgi:hypothetical protein